MKDHDILLLRRMSVRWEPYEFGVGVSLSGRYAVLYIQIGFLVIRIWR